MKTYLVTGGAGFIGSHFIRLLLSNDDDIKVVNLDALTYAANLKNLEESLSDHRYYFEHADVCDGQVVDRIFQRHNPDYVVHFAAESHVDNSITTPQIFEQTNVGGTVTLLGVARAHWAQGDGFRAGVRYLQVSTDEVYGTLGETDSFREDSPLAPRSPYSASKASADLFVSAYCATYQFPALITRCSNNYGPCQHHEKLIPLILRNACRAEMLPVYGDGLQVRDWLYVEDHCRAIQLVLGRGHLGGVYNIGGNNEQTNLALVKQLLAALRKRGVDAPDALIRHVTDRKGHDRRYSIDHSKLTRELGWQPQTDWLEGLAKTVDWYLQQQLVAQ